MDSVLFEKLDYIGKALRKNPTRLFGGIQIVAVGDFFQLPSIIEKSMLSEPPKPAAALNSNVPSTVPIEQPPRHIFNSKSWKEGMDVIQCILLFILRT